MASTFTEAFADRLDFTEPLFVRAVAAIILQPIIWQIVARTEYKTRFLSKTLGSAQRAVFFLAAQILVLGRIRDIWIDEAMKAQPTLPALDTPLNGYVSLALIVVGMQFVFTSFWALGFNGTFLGDYCGILMTARVTGYPYTLLDNPMYVGSTMAFLGRALGAASPIGFVLTACIAVAYYGTLLLEEPFTAKIYADAEKTKKSKNH